MLLSFVSLGTVGDVAPLIAVGQELQRRGHCCELLTNQCFVPAAQRAGLSAHAVSAQVGIMRGVPRLDDYLYCAAAAIAEHLQRSQPQLIVNCDRYCTSNLIAERQRVPVVRLHLSPFKLRPYDQRRTPSYQLFARDPRVLAHVNQRRSALGLAAVTNAFHAEPYVARHVATFPDWLCDEPPHGAPELEFVGFPLPPERTPLAPELRAFIERHGRPLVFTHGTGNEDLGGFLRLAELCCQQLGLPGVALCPSGVGEWRGSERLLLAPFTPLGALLPQARLLVHHGGIGTAARALEAQIPQVVLPLRFDQPDNGARLARLGVASVLEPRQCSVPALASTIRALLGSSAVASRSAELGRRIRGAAAIERWADVLEANVELAA